MLLVGEYRDVFVRMDGVLKLKERRCVYDSLLIPTARSAFPSSAGLR